MPSAARYLRAAGTARCCGWRPRPLPLPPSAAARSAPACGAEAGSGSPANTTCTRSPRSPRTVTSTRPGRRRGRWPRSRPRSSRSSRSPSSASRTRSSKTSRSSGRPGCSSRRRSRPAPGVALDCGPAHDHVRPGVTATRHHLARPTRARGAARPARRHTRGPGSASPRPGATRLSRAESGDGPEPVGQQRAQRAGLEAERALEPHPGDARRSAPPS